MYYNEIIAIKIDYDGSAYTMAAIMIPSGLPRRIKKYNKMNKNIVSMVIIVPIRPFESID